MMARLLYCALLCWPALALADDARLAIDKTWQAFRGQIQTEQELVAVQVLRQGEAPLDKLLWRRVQYTEGGQRLSIKFLQPVADLGLGLLVERALQGGDQVWLRLPSWNSARKVIGNRETKSFADTAFTFEDSKQLVSENTSQFDYRYQGSQIVATPKAGVISGYVKRVISLDARGVPQKIEYFEQDGAPAKTLSFEDIQFPAPGRWRANRLVMTQHAPHSQTILTVRQRQFNLALGAAYFSQAHLLEAEHAPQP